MKKERIKNFFNHKTTRTIIVLLAALLLVVAIYRIFFKNERTTSSFEATKLEERLSRILSGIDGVKDASVMVNEEDGKAVSAVVVFYGADSILTRIRVIDATAGALGIEKAKILVYPAESKS